MILNGEKNGPKTGKMLFTVQKGVEEENLVSINRVNFHSKDLFKLRLVYMLITSNF